MNAASSSLQAPAPSQPGFPGGLAVPLAAGFREAIRAAVDRVGATAPNPPVGCAILDAAGRILVVAAHQRAGAPHAEALALRLLNEAGLTARATTLLATLEPCNHHGRTGPCTEAILASGIRDVWIGSPDPNPHVAGHGAGRLRAAGCTVRFLHDQPGHDAASLGRDCLALVAPFSRLACDGRPWITVKQALDADGGMIPPPGASTFTSSASLRLAHRLRRCTDAIVTGIGTILADAPAFTVRHLSDHTDRRPRLLVVLGDPGRLPPGYLRTAQANGFDVRALGSLDLLLPTLAEAGVLWAMVEAGPRLLHSLRQPADPAAVPVWDDWLTIRRNPAATAGPDAPDRLAITLSRQDGDVSPLRLLPELHDLELNQDQACSQES